MYHVFPTPPSLSRPPLLPMWYTNLRPCCSRTHYIN